MQLLGQNLVDSYCFPQHRKSNLSSWSSFFILLLSLSVAGSHSTSHLTPLNPSHHCKSSEIQGLIILPLHIAPVAIHHPSCYMGQPETLWKLQRSQKSRSWHESRPSAAVVWSAVNHCKPMAQLEQKTLLVSTGWLGTPFTFLFILLHCSHLLINVLVCVPLVPVIQTQQNGEEPVLLWKQSLSLHPHLNRNSLKHFIPQG